MTILEFPKIDPTSSMKGPEREGCDVLVDGRHVPNMHMRDHGDTIEFVLDGRFSYTFPREWALLAASFAAQAMAIGAGHLSLSGCHRSTLPYAPEAMALDQLPKK